MSVINTNIKSLVARDALTINNRQLSTAMERLSTGKRINSAADDAAGLSISSKMDSQVRGLQMAVKNSYDAISVTQTAEGAMQEINNILQRMRELAVQGASDSNSNNDRAFLQAEVAQLSDEINRIASTTQFNGINVLDGGFANKTFQIGANAGQTMRLSIGDMRSNALGVASSEITQTVATPSSTQTESATLGLRATGVGAAETQVRLTFGGTATTGSAAFNLTDSVSGLSTDYSASLDINDEYSKSDYVVGLNKALRQSATDTSLTGTNSSATGNSAATAIADITDVDNFDKMKFAVKLGDGEPVQNIDLRQRLASNGVTTAATNVQVATAIQQELRVAFADTNESLTVTYNSAAGDFTVTDAEGRSIEISQGAGDGFLFGTDLANDGAISIAANIQSNIYAAWDGDALVLTNTAGGGITMDTVRYATGRTITFDAATGQEQQADPVLFASANVSTTTASYYGVVESTSLALRFSNQEGPAGTNSAMNAGSASYSFNITNGDGDIYATITNLDVYKTRSEAAVIADIRSALSTGIAANMSADNTIDLSEFDVAYVGDTLTITNSAGRALQISSFSSNVGSVDVIPLNELGSLETLASKSQLFSTVRVGVNQEVLGSTVGSGGILFQMKVDGTWLGGSAGIALSASFAGTDGFPSTTAALVSALSSAIQAQNTTNMVVNSAQISAVIDVSSITVGWDDSSDSLVITDAAGRALTFGLAATNDLFGTGEILTADVVQTASNRGNVVDTVSNKVQGDVVESTRVALTLNTTSERTFNFSVNGQALGDTTYDPSAAFQGSSLQTNLNALMVSLNAAHPDNVFEYAVEGPQITIWQRDGGQVDISSFTATGVGDDDLTLTIQGGTGQGGTVVAREVDALTGQTSATSVEAKGTLATRTEATITLSSDDAYGIVVNNGDSDFTLAPQVVDLSETASVQTFTTKLEAALDGSGISASMDLNGKIYLTRADGGEINLKSFTSVGNGSGVWTPKVGQGEQAQLDGSGTLVGITTVTNSTESISVGGGNTAISQLSVATQSGSTAAIAVVDRALSYVNSERSKLGAVENRLVHTIDNLSNVITNTEASRSRIVDTDYAAETSELARTQIIQQAATAMLAQANQSAQSVLSLLQ